MEDKWDNYMADWLEGYLEFNYRQDVLFFETTMEGLLEILRVIRDHILGRNLY